MLISTRASTATSSKVCEGFASKASSSAVNKSPASGTGGGGCTSRGRHRDVVDGRQRLRRQRRPALRLGFFNAQPIQRGRHARQAAGPAWAAPSNDERGASYATAALDDLT